MYVCACVCVCVCVCVCEWMCVCVCVCIKYIRDLIIRQRARSIYIYTHT